LLRLEEPQPANDLVAAQFGAGIPKQVAALEARSVAKQIADREFPRGIGIE
jgi:hypothetical protein